MAIEYKIGSFLKRIKRPIVLDANQDYKLVTISSKHRGVKLREHKKGALIKSNMYEVKRGDFILSGIDARHGAFGIIPKELDGAIVTNDFWYFKIDESIISKRLFLELTATTWFDEICQRGSDGTTNRVRLQKDKFFNQKVLLPELKDQESLLNYLLTFKASSNKLKGEIKNQRNLIKNLKQSILQDAIQGELTKDWRKENPTIEPASELLKRIKAEKAQLIKEKKIKKEKPLPAIRQEEVPFELPEGWSWCRLGEICDNITSGSTPSKDSFIKGEIPYLKVYNIKGQKIEFDYKPQFIKRDVHEGQLKRCILSPGDVVMNIVGPPLGKVAIIPDDYEQWNCNQAISIFRCIDEKVNPFIYQYLCTGLYLNYLHFKGMAGQDNISVTMCKELVMGLPPLEEQKAIVQKIETLLQKCTALEQEIAESKANAEMLMQAVLMQAFEEKEEKEVEEVEKVEYNYENK